MEWKNDLILCRTKEWMIAFFIFGDIMSKKYEKKHDAIVEYYCKIENIFFINEPIYEIIKEKSLADLFGINSYKTPDLMYFCEDNIYIGEVKGNISFRNKGKSKGQVLGYYDILKENGIDTVPFVVLDYFVKFV